MSNKYLEKIASEVAKAQEKKLNRDAWGATGRSMGRSFLEGTGGSLAGGVIGLGVGNKLADSYIRQGRLHPRVGPAAAKVFSSMGAGLGTMIGATHGQKASIKNTLRKERNM